MKRILIVIATLAFFVSSPQAADLLDSPNAVNDSTAGMNESLAALTVFTQDTGASPGISGSWYDPSNSGHGFMLQVLEPTPPSVSDRLYAIWNTYDRAGNQAWIFGVGEFDGNSVFMDAFITAVVIDDGSFPPTFSESESGLEVFPWGQLVFDFASCNSGEVTFDTGYPDFSASGTISLIRLTRLKGQTCDLEGAGLNDMFNLTSNTAIQDPSIGEI